MDGKSILLVDDDEKRLNLLNNTFTEFGYKKINVADRSDNAWVILKSKKIDCVVCSYEMQEMSGIALLKILRRDDQISDTPFFLIDPAFTKIKVLKAGQNGATGLFVVPFDGKAMQKKIIKALAEVKEPIIVQTQKTLDQGLEFIENKEYVKALTVFAKLVNQKEAPEYYFNIGYIKTSQGKHNEAIEAFTKATKLDRLFARAYEAMGRAYKLIGDLEKSEKHMQLAAEIYMDTDKLDSAEDVLTEVLESGIQSLNVFNTLGVIYRKKGNTDIALRQYKKALKIHPDESYLYYNIGRLYLDMKNTSEAKVYFQEALDRDHDFLEAKQVLKAIDLGII